MDENEEEMKDRIHRRDEKVIDEIEERPRVIIKTRTFRSGTQIQWFKHLTREEGLRLKKKLQKHSE
jgi:hypothetical protein